MNERIRELGLVATQFTNDTVLQLERVHNRDYDFDEIDDIYNQKFAELIVKECYEHCRGQILDKEVADTNELTYNDAVGDCANGLLQHFGVEP